jgi:hypothetical protein
MEKLDAVIVRALNASYVDVAHFYGQCAATHNLVCAEIALLSLWPSSVKLIISLQTILRPLSANLESAVHMIDAAGKYQR